MGPVASKSHGGVYGYREYLCVEPVDWLVIMTGIKARVSKSAQGQVKHDGLARPGHVRGKKTNGRNAYASARGERVKSKVTGQEGGLIQQESLGAGFYEVTVWLGLRWFLAQRPVEVEGGRRIVGVDSSSIRSGKYEQTI